MFRGGGGAEEGKACFRCCMCMCTLSDESSLIEVGESFETVTNGVALLKEIQNGCLQLDSAATECSNHVNKDVYKLYATQFESRISKSKNNNRDSAPKLVAYALTWSFRVGRNVATT